MKWTHAHTVLINYHIYFPYISECNKTVWYNADIDIIEPEDMKSSSCKNDDVLNYGPQQAQLMTAASGDVSKAQLFH